MDLKWKQIDNLNDKLEIDETVESEDKKFFSLKTIESYKVETNTTYTIEITVALQNIPN